MWPSGLRRVTRNHFSYGGVGSNPATVVFSKNLLSEYVCEYGNIGMWDETL